MNKEESLTIKQEIINPGDEEMKRVAFIMGWGNTLKDEWLPWFREKVKREGWSVLVIALPFEFNNFQQIKADIVAALNDFKGEILLCHSMGSLFGRYISLKEYRMRIFLSPFWKIPKRTLILGSLFLSQLMLSLLKWCRKPILSRNFSDADIGEIDLPTDSPRYISPATMNEVITAQSKLPELTESDQTIYSRDDRVIDTTVCKGITYKGGHFAFCVEDRDAIFATLSRLIDESSSSQ